LGLQNFGLIMRARRYMMSAIVNLSLILLEAISFLDCANVTAI
jgi:hypothetical protein